MAQNYGSPITGTLAATTAIVALTTAVQYPVTLVLKSADGARAIQLSFDGGVSYFPAVTPTLTATGELVYALTYPATNVKFTGAVNDTYSIL